MGFCKLSEKTILVTGASSGIGKQAAIQISQQGGTLVITGRDEKRLADTFQSLEGDNHRMFVANLEDEQELNDMVAELPKIVGLVHCAGIVGPMPVKFIRKENIEKLMRINFEVPVLLTGRILLMKKLLNDSSIVFISTVATQMPYFGGALYNSSKSAIESYSKTLALELVKKGIRSNCLSPGLVNTPLIKKPVSEGQMEIVDESLGRYLKKYPMGIGEPEDVANAIVFFLSDESKWISGTNLVMGGVLQ